MSTYKFPLPIPLNIMCHTLGSFLVNYQHKPSYFHDLFIYLAITVYHLPFSYSVTLHPFTQSLTSLQDIYMHFLLCLSFFQVCVTLQIRPVPGFLGVRAFCSTGVVILTDPPICGALRTILIVVIGTHFS